MIGGAPDGRIVGLVFGTKDIVGPIGLVKAAGGERHPDGGED